MHYLIVSFSHKNCDIATRELLSIEDFDKLHTFYKNLLSNDHINEAVILSTCNRVEVILSASDISNTTKLIYTELNRYSNIDISELDNRADVYEDKGAIHHLFSVASSLDSLVVGETQITGQLKDAFKFAKNYEYCGPKLTKVINYSFKCAANVRNETEISKNPVSIASAAVSYADDVLSLGGTTAVVVGAGEMAELAIKNLIKKDVNIILINRTLHKAQELARTYKDNVIAKEYSELKNLLNKYRLLFTATSASHAVITQNMVEHRDFTRHWFDMAVPRDIDVSYDEKIKVYSVDDLQLIVNKNRELREEQAAIAYKIIRDMTNEFFESSSNAGVEPLIKEIRLKVNECIEDEVSKALHKRHISPDMEDVIKKTIYNTFNKFLDTPTKKMRESSKTKSNESLIDAIEYLFNNKSK